jgi:hypothetical protein
MTLAPDRLDVAFRTTLRDRPDAPAATLATFTVAKGSREVVRTG